MRFSSVIGLKYGFGAVAVVADVIEGEIAVRHPFGGVDGFHFQRLGRAAQDAVAAALALFFLDDRSLIDHVDRMERADSGAGPAAGALVLFLQIWTEAAGHEAVNAVVHTYDNRAAAVRAAVADKVRSSATYLSFAKTSTQPFASVVTVPVA